MVEFIQEAPHLGNQFTEDIGLQEFLFSFLGDNYSQNYSYLSDFGHKVVYDLLPHSHLCEKFPPVLEEYSAWGEKIDKIYTHPSWTYMHTFSSASDLIGLGYSEMVHNRIIQFVKLYLFSPSSGLYMCPLAMTDGAAYLIKEKFFGDPELRYVFSRLTSSNPALFWTSGQWMTEKMGGSDVNFSTRTIAKHVQGDLYELYGFKWFTSATTADISFTLARVEGKVSLFLVKVFENKGKINVVRLKDKLGTKQLPTAEMKLEGCIARLLGPIGEGIRLISSMMNITRLYNSIGAIGAMRRATAIARDYAYRRKAFNKAIIEHPLHKKTLFLLELQTRGCLILLLYIATLLEKQEKKNILTWEADTLRVLTPVIKLYTGKMCSAVIKEAMESIGGVAYMENSGFPGLLRNSEVYSIWEGTTNILSLDVNRAIIKTNDKKLEFLQRSLHSIHSNANLIHRIAKIAEISHKENMLRNVAFEIGNVFISALLHWHAEKMGTDQSKEMANYWENNFIEKFCDVSDGLIENLSKNYFNGRETGGGNLDKFMQARFKL